MPETPEQLHARATGALRSPPVQDWETFPFVGHAEPRALEAPLEREPPRAGEGGADCPRCARTDADYIWTDAHWRLTPLGEPSGLPIILLLEPREHFAEPGDLPDELACELGVLLGRVERAIRAVGEIGRVHVCRWGDGAEHLHWWFLARPARLPQLMGSFAAVWDDVLPPTPRDVWEDNLRRFQAAFVT